MTERKDTCGNCRCMDRPDPGKRDGTCRAEPPNGRHPWPRVLASDWCAKHKPVPKTKIT